MKNNVIINGEILSKRKLGANFIINLNSNNSSEIVVIISTSTWENFNNFFHTKNVCLSGILTDEQTINATSISCFHNELEDECETRFEGRVKLVKKFDFNTPSKLYLKRLVFETENQVQFQAVALRKQATFFETIKEGTCLKLVAIYVSGDMPYWRIKNAEII